MRVVLSSVRVVALALAVVFVAASTTTGKRGGGPSKTSVYYEPRPELQWQPRAGVTYRVVLSTVPRGGGERAQVLADIYNYTERRWRPDFDLDFGAAYDFYVYDQSSKSVLVSMRFTVGFQKPQVLFPAENARVNNLSPRFEWAPAAYSQVWYDVTIAESQAMDSPIVTSHLIPQQGNERVQPGRDAEFGTADDIKYLRWVTDGVLQANKSYFWKVQAYYFGRSDVASGVTPDRMNAIGRAETMGRFTIPPQSGASDALANVTRVTTDQANTVQPTMSKNGEMAYVQIDPDGGSEIRVAVAKIRDGRPVFDTGREAFTKKVERSWDLSPQWDIDGEGMYFASNRSQDTFNIWYKRRDTRGYTQLTFHDSDALFPSVSRDGNKIVYQLGDWDPGSNNCASQCTIWVIDRDGKAATELGNGEKPVLSPDGRRIAFVDRGDIWVMDTSGSNKIQLTNDHADNDFPVWHPSGTRLVFVSERSGNMDLWDVEIDGARMTQLTNYLGPDITPEFTPDGKNLLFASTRGGKWRSIWMGEMGR
jgi:Tol biopolymer transport system component